MHPSVWSLTIVAVGCAVGAAQAASAADLGRPPAAGGFASSTSFEQLAATPLPQRWNAVDADDPRAVGTPPAAHAPSAPIPEPRTYAMLLAGLGVVIAIARRRSPMR